MNHDEEFDRVLDEALAEYRDAEPLAGMEHRVLQRVRLRAERRRAWLRWSAFATCTAMLAVTAWTGVRDRARHETMPIQPEATQEQRPPVQTQPRNENIRAVNMEPATTSTRVVKPMPSRKAVLASATRVPVQPQFPAPAPLNPEERAWLALAQVHPEVLSRLPNDQDKQQIAIAPIDIEPLANPASGNQGEN
jgi:cytoskeletal protein RodZ